MKSLLPILSCLTLVALCASASAQQPSPATPASAPKPAAKPSGLNLQDGDRFLYQPVLLDREVGVSETKEPTTTLPAQRGRTCVDVQVVRAGGRASDPLRICADT